MSRPPSRFAPLAEPEVSAALAALRAWLNARRCKLDQGAPDCDAGGTYARLVEDIIAARMFLPGGAADRGRREREQDAAFDRARPAAARAAQGLEAFFAQHPRAAAAWWEVRRAYGEAGMGLPAEPGRLFAALALAIGVTESFREHRAEGRKLTGVVHEYYGCVMFRSDRAGVKPWSPESLLLFALVYQVRTHLVWCETGQWKLLGPMPQPARGRTPWALIGAVVRAVFPSDQGGLDGRAAKKQFEALMSRNPDAEYCGWWRQPLSGPDNFSSKGVG